MAETIPLRFAGVGRIARLRELTGRDEYGVKGASTGNAIALLDSLLESDPVTGAIEPPAADLVAADRDRLLAVVYKRAFGDRIESTLICARCREPFDLHFSLDRLIDSVSEAKSDVGWRVLEDGRFEVANGVTFRLPTGKDELVGDALSPAEAESLLQSRCIVEGIWSENHVGFQELLEQVAPLIDLELGAQCPECNHAQAVEFDIQTYVLGSIVAERRRLLTEINRIAKAYSWSLEEILSLSRSDRRQFVQLIESELLTC